MQKAFLLWSRPAFPSSLSAGSWAMGSRPNSPPQTTSVLVEQAALLQIAQQGGDRLVGALAGGLQVDRQAVVVVPDLAVDVELHEADAALDQPAGHQAAAAVGVGRLAADAVHLQRGRRLPATGRGRRWPQLHAGGQLVAGDAGVELRLARPLRVGGCDRAGPAGRARMRDDLGRLLDLRVAGSAPASRSSGSACPGRSAAGSPPASSARR